MADNKINLRILTPSKVFYDSDVDMVIMRTTTGDMGILKGHIPLTTNLALGVLKINKGNEVSHAAIFEGFVEVTPDRITIITDDANWPEDIDLERAKEARDRAEKRLGEKYSEINITRAEIALRRALLRLELYHIDKK